jgi:hypothetical protein
VTVMLGANKRRRACYRHLQHRPHRGGGGVRPDEATALPSAHVPPRKAEALGAHLIRRSCEAVELKPRDAARLLNSFEATLKLMGC